MERIQVKANYSFWKHPIRWVKEIKYRIIAEHLINHEWNNGLEEKHKKKMEEILLYGPSEEETQ